MSDSHNDQGLFGDVAENNIGRAPQRRSYLTQFEKDNFHPYNVLPDRPLTAFFKPSERMDSKAI